MSTIKKNILFILALLCLGECIAQNAVQDFKMINNTYVKNELLSMDIEYIYYQDENSKIATETKKGSFKKSGKNILSSLIGITTIQNERYMWMIDNENKVIVVSKPKISFDMTMISSIDSMLKVCSSVDFKELSKKEHSYQLNFNKNSDNYKSISVIYNADTYFLNNITISFREPVLTDVNNEASVKKIPKLKIQYSNINTKPNLSSISFSEQKYFEVKDQKIFGKGQYKEYTFINNILANEK